MFPLSLCLTAKDDALHLMTVQQSSAEYLGSSCDERKTHRRHRGSPERTLWREDRKADEQILK